MSLTPTLRQHKITGFNQISALLKLQSLSSKGSLASLKAGVLTCLHFCNNHKREIPWIENCLTRGQGNGIRAYCIYEVDPNWQRWHIRGIIAKPKPAEEGQGGPEGGAGGYYVCLPGEGGSGKDLCTYQGVGEWYQCTLYP